MKTIPQRELRNEISRVLREVESGEQFRVTVAGRPVADIVPITGRRQTFVPRAHLLQILSEASLDADFVDDVDTVLGATIDELDR